MNALGKSPMGAFRRGKWLGRRVIDTVISTNELLLIPYGKDCLWNIVPDGLNADSVILSGGVGKDISFEKELVHYFGCQVYLYDPSPTGAGTMALAENQNKNIHFEPVGIAGSPGVVEFAEPVNPEEGSYTTTVGRAARKVSFECKTLPQLIEQTGARQIDLLKLDIEGFEYDVLEHIIHSPVPILQLCLEFHDRFPHVKTFKAVRALRARGYRLIYKSSLDMTFLLER